VAAGSTQNNTEEQDNDTHRPYDFYNNIISCHCFRSLFSFSLKINEHPNIRKYILTFIVSVIFISVQVYLLPVIMNFRGEVI